MLFKNIKRKQVQNILKTVKFLTTKLYGDNTHVTTFNIICNTQNQYTRSTYFKLKQID